MVNKPRPGRWYVALALAVCLVGSGLGVLSQPLFAALPQPVAAPTLPASYRIPGTAPALQWPATGQAPWNRRASGDG